MCTYIRVGVCVFLCVIVCNGTYKCDVKLEIFALLTLFTHFTAQSRSIRSSRSEGRVRLYKYTNISESLFVSILRVLIPSIILPNESPFFFIA